MKVSTNKRLEHRNAVLFVPTVTAGYFIPEEHARNSFWVMLYGIVFMRPRIGWYEVYQSSEGNAVTWEMTLPVEAIPSTVSIPHRCVA